MKVRLGVLVPMGIQCIDEVTIYVVDRAVRSDHIAAGRRGWAIRDGRCVEAVQ